MMQYNIQIVSIEGNIGSGKSTLLSILKQHYKDNHNVSFLKEPVDEWSNIKDENGITILEKFYNDQEKYSFPFQMMAYISRLKLLKEKVEQIKKQQDEWYQNKTQQKLLNYDESQENIVVPCYSIITERSLFTDKMVFAKMLYDSGKIESVNYKIYINWFETFANEFPVDKIIYVNADPTTCFNRIKIRHREGEEHIPLDYLTSCHNYHEEMIHQFTLDKKTQLHLDGNVDIYSNNKTIEEWIERVEIFIK